MATKTNWSSIEYINRPDRESSETRDVYMSQEEFDQAERKISHADGFLRIWIGKKNIGWVTWEAHCSNCCSCESDWRSPTSENMYFGTEEKPQCGICEHEMEPGMDKSLKICTDCAKDWRYVGEEDCYFKNFCCDEEDDRGTVKAQVNIIIV